MSQLGFGIHGRITAIVLHAPRAGKIEIASRQHLGSDGQMSGFTGEPQGRAVKLRQSQAAAEELLAFKDRVHSWQ
jgi:hypothetical protein